MEISLLSPSITAVRTDGVDAIPYSGSTSTHGWGVFIFSNQSIKQHSVFSVYKRTASKLFMAFFVISY
jgi:hypothetical protein